MSAFDRNRIICLTLQEHDDDDDEIKRQPIGNQGSEKKVQVVEKKWKRGCQLPHRDAKGR